MCTFLHWDCGRLVFMILCKETLLLPSFVFNNLSSSFLICIWLARMREASDPAQNVGRDCWMSVHVLHAFFSKGLLLLRVLLRIVNNISVIWVFFLLNDFRANSVVRLQNNGFNYHIWGPVLDIAYLLFMLPLCGLDELCFSTVLW